MAVNSLTQAPIKSGAFFLGGNATFTVAVPGEFVAEHPECKDHYTFRIRRKEAGGGWPETWFVSMLVGPNNDVDYAYAGILELRTMTLRLTAKSCLSANSWPKLVLERVLACAVTGQLHKIEAAGWLLMHEGRCCICGRKLTVPESIEAGIGPECAGRVGNGGGE